MVTHVVLVLDEPTIWISISLERLYGYDGLFTI